MIRSIVEAVQGRGLEQKQISGKERFAREGAGRLVYDVATTLMQRGSVVQLVERESYEEEGAYLGVQWDPIAVYTPGGKCLSPRNEMFFTRGIRIKALDGEDSMRVEVKRFDFDPNSWRNRSYWEAFEDVVDSDEFRDDWENYRKQFREKNGESHWMTKGVFALQHILEYSAT